MFKPTASRYGFIDSIRGIAACLVMLQHALYASGLLEVGQGHFLHGFMPTFLELGETGVVAFFLVSCFVIPLSLEKTANFRLFWLHRILRIYPLYLAIYLINIFMWGHKTLTDSVAYLKNGLAHLFMVQEYVGQTPLVGGAWTLSIEMVWYIGLSAMFLFALNKKTNLLVGLTIGVSVLACLVCALGTHVPMGRLSMLVCCVLGLVCFRREHGDITHRHFAILSAILTLLIAVNLSFGFWLFPAANPSAGFTVVHNSWLLAGLVFFVPYFLRKHSIWDHSVLAFLGRISYSIYLVHGVILGVLGKTSLQGWWFVAATFALAFIIAPLTYRFIESPPIRFGHRWKRKGAVISI